MKRIVGLVLSLIAIVSVFSLLPTNVNAANKLDIYLFWGDGCPHCAKEKAYLAEILPDYPNINLNTYEIYGSQENAILMQKTVDELDLNVGAVPFLVIGDKEFVGYAEGTTDKEIIDRLQYCTENSCPDSIASIVPGIDNEDLTNESPKAEVSKNETEKTIDLPFLGKINALDFSLPLLAIIIGTIDGFNPCALWTLMFLISLLLGMESRRRMWALGITFIIASASVYFLFMAAWLQLILFLSFVVWVRTMIGALAVAGGGYSLFDYLKNRNKESGCKVAGNEKRQLVFAKMKAIAHQNSIWLALGGIIILAFAVNLVELVCSAGFPAIFTQVLSISNLPSWQYYAYILLYVLFFMLDDIVIFVIAMLTLKVTGVSTKYGKVSKVAGGIALLIIGLILIFKPELLMFG